MSNLDKNLTTVSTEQLEANKSKLTIQVTAEAFKDSLRAVYNKNKGYFNIPGFRKGKAPRVIIEQYYGKEVFHEDAINHILEDAYSEALDKSGIDAIYRPDIDLGEVSEATGIAFTAQVFTRPSVEIEGYHGLTHPKFETEPTAEEIDNALRHEQEKNARQVSANRPAKLDDIVNINFTGYVDGEPFEGGKGEFVDLTLGSKRFIPGFEEQLVGASAGDDVKVNVTFPEDYGHTDLASKAAVFEVEIVDVKEKQMPELDDDFAQDISEFDTLAEYRDDIAERIRKNKTDNLENDKRGHIMEKLAKMIVADVPEVMYTGRLDDMFDSYKRQVEMQGMDIENYLRFSGLTEQGLRNSWQAQAKLEIDSLLALEAIADKENIQVDEAEFEEKFAEASGMKDDGLKKFIEEMHPRRKADLHRSYRCDKAMDFVMEHAIATDEPDPIAITGEVLDAE